MSLILQRHHKNVQDAASAYRLSLDEIEGHLRIRAMSNDASPAELALLMRLKDEKAAILRRYENLGEAFKALIQISGMAAE
ncbi:hypothetical protein G6L32_25615 [Agrobacterium tumefaciens]|uniref:hypothetical protein n=1 Tax=Agrobacterium tumefaciens TaxID=358 RepID=UPI000673E4BD|nr:hypothetical protein [Agrobacterium tumefaciens]NTA62011.1 hypothetical protein [Agrobacterium tumefaciens]NTZ63262.1 hypothetical protein [Agrobacterium tumefaciens]UXR94862.1 hypothetical protein FY157_24300 [Agrobacterium tumefaciens]